MNEFVTVKPLNKVDSFQAGASNRHNVFKWLDSHGLVQARPA